MNTQERNSKTEPSNSLIPTDLYNQKTLFSLSGSSVAVWLFSTVLADAFGIDVTSYKWIGLFVALIISFIGIMRNTKLNFEFGTIAFFNGLLIFVTASGIDSIKYGTKVDSSEKDNAALFGVFDNKPWWPAKHLQQEIRDLKDSTRSLTAELNLANSKTKELINETSNDERHNATLGDSITYLLNEINRLSIKIQSQSNPVIISPQRDNSLIDENETLKKQLAELKSEMIQNKDLKIQEFAKDLGYPNFNSEAVKSLTPSALRRLLKLGYFGNDKWYSILDDHEEFSFWYYYSDQIEYIKELVNLKMVETKSRDLYMWQEFLIKTAGQGKRVYRCENGSTSEEKETDCQRAVVQYVLYKGQLSKDKIERLEDGAIKLSEFGRQVYRLIIENSSKLITTE